MPKTKRKVVLEVVRPAVVERADIGALSPGDAIRIHETFWSDGTVSWKCFYGPPGFGVMPPPDLTPGKTPG